MSERVLGVDLLHGDVWCTLGLWLVGVGCVAGVVALVCLSAIGLVLAGLALVLGGGTWMRARMRWVRVLRGEVNPAPGRAVRVLMLTRGGFVVVAVVLSLLVSLLAT